MIRNVAAFLLGCVMAILFLFSIPTMQPNALSAQSQTKEIQIQDLTELYGLNLQTETATNNKLEKFACENVNHLVHLQIMINSDWQPESDNSLRFIFTDNIPGHITRSEFIFANNFVDWRDGSYYIEGYFIVSEQGMHQGIIEYNFEPVPLTKVLLNPNVKIVPFDFSKPDPTCDNG